MGRESQRVAGAHEPDSAGSLRGSVHPFHARSPFGAAERRAEGGGSGPCGDAGQVPGSFPGRQDRRLRDRDTAYRPAVVLCGFQGRPAP